MHTDIFKLITCGVMLVCITVAPAMSFQVSKGEIRHQKPTIIEQGQQVELTFSALGINTDRIQDAFLYYRYDDDLAYRQRNVSLEGTDFQIEIDIDSENAKSIEYYFEVVYNSGENLRYPTDLYSTGPVQVQIVEERDADKLASAIPVEHTILSPDPGTTVAVNDVVIAITLFYNPAEIDTANSSFQLLLDEQDITDQARAHDYFFTYAPDDIEAGDHTVSLLFHKPDTTIKITEWNFRALNAGDTFSYATDNYATETSENPFLPTGRVELSGRTQNIGGYSNDVLSGNIRLSGQHENISYSAHGTLTSQEDPRLQPLNRYGAELYVDNWLEFQAGHVYPRLSPLTISGQRIQGLNTGVRLFNEAVNLRFLYGKMSRSISNLYEPVDPQYREFSGAVVDTSYSLNFQNNGVGTYKRNIIGGRVALGRSDNFRTGFNFLKVRDDTNSISVISDFNDLMDTDPQLAANLSEQERQSLDRQPDLLSVNGNPRPKDNVVGSYDLRFSLDNNRINFRADAGASLLNEDISGGPMTEQKADELGIHFHESYENLLERLSWLIIINENMSTLAFRFVEDGESQRDAELVFPKGVIATQSEAGFNYFNNYLRINYRWVGPDFNSLANNTVRKDIAGFTISDRIRFLQDQVYLTLGYESLNDNVINNKEATTNTVTYRSNLSWYPIKPVLPQVSVGFMARTRDNGVALFNPHVSPGLEDVAVRNFVEQDGQVTLGPNPRNSDTYQVTSSVRKQFDLLGISHDASLNFSFLNTSDRYFNYGDMKSTNFSLNIANRYQDMPLRTNIGFNLNDTQTSSGLTEITIYGLNLGGSMFFLDDRLNIDASFAFTKNRSESVPLEVNDNGTTDTFDNFYEPNQDARSISESNSLIVNTSARYDITQNHAVFVDFRYNNISSVLNQRSFPNDHLLRARYIFNF